MRPSNTLTWLQNAGNPISDDLNFKTFSEVDVPGGPGGYCGWDTGGYRVGGTPFSKILYPPQISYHTLLHKIQDDHL